MDDAGRYRLTLTTDGRPTAHGWWDSRATAESKFASWIGTHGRDGAHIVLVDTATGDLVKSWP